MPVDISSDMNPTSATAMEVCKVLDTLSALAVDLSCDCEVAPDTLILSAQKARDACAAIEEGVMAFMDTIAIPKGAPNIDAAYKALAQAISPEGQKVIATNLTQAVINKDAVALVDDVNRQVYQYDSLDNLFKKARFVQFWPLAEEGEFVTFDQVLEEYQRFLKA